MNTNLYKTFVVVVALALGTLACGLLGSIPSSVSSIPSSVALLATTASNSTSSILLQDDFTDSSTNWGTGSDANKSVQYTNGSLEFKVFKASDFIFSTPNDQDYQSVHIEVKATPNSSDPKTSFGVFCDQQVTTDAFYYFAVRSTGEYAIVKSAIAKDDVFLTGNNDWGKSKLIPANASSYTIGVDCGNGRLALYVNGTQVDSVMDSTYTTGKVGLFTWSDTVANSVDVDFNSFVMTPLK